jgi:Domain of unknown function (DUF4328)
LDDQLDDQLNNRLNNQLDDQLNNRSVGGAMRGADGSLLAMSDIGTPPGEWPRPTVGPRQSDSIAGLSLALSVLLWVGVGLAALSAVDSLANLAWLRGRDPDGLDMLTEQPLSWVTASSTLAGATLLVFVATIVIWLIWQFRATRNLQTWNVGMRRGSGWAIGAWFVPIIWWWWPAQNVHDLLRGSKPSLAPLGGFAPREPAEPIIGWWWAVWLLSSLAGQLSNRAFLNAYENSGWTLAYALDLVTQTLAVASGVLAVTVVGRVAQRQHERMALTQA